MRAFAEHLLELAATGWGPTVLVLHAYLEGFILPVAHEFFLIPVALARPHLSFVFALMSTVASTLGISTGYLIGYFGGRPILAKFMNSRLLVSANRKLAQYDVWAVAIACFTPIPVKIFVLLAGAARINFKKLVIVAFISRGLRFFLVSLLLYIYGEPIREWILNYMDRVMIIVLAVIVGSFVLWKISVRIFVKKSADAEISS